MKKYIHAYISGIVQGVGFRYFAYKWAKRLGISGYVRNLRDGRVEVEAEGEEDVLREFIKKLEEGPLGAVVERVEVIWGECKNRFMDFEIR
ncbi:acylphosphatase [Dictyoglomus sp.]|jgi:acylphosphatase|uniref:acylphosphatase n=1 Tax=Dictyoglomus sp. TaxID=28205 RepID=UPI003D149AE2